MKSIVEIISLCTRATGEINGRCNKLYWWKTQNLEEEYQYVLNYTKFLPDSASMAQRLYHLKNYLPHIPLCFCNQSLKWQKQSGKYGTYCSKKCTAMATRKLGNTNPFSNPNIQKKAKKTTMEKYGVDNFAKTPEFSKLIKEINQQKSVEEKQNTIEKRKNTNKDRYGHTTPLLNPTIQEKITKTMLEEYGVESPLQSMEILQRAKETNTKRYGKSHFSQQHLSDEFLTNIQDINWIAVQLQTKSLRELAEEHSISYSHICKLVKKAGYNLCNYSGFETEVHQLIKELCSGKIKRNDRTILNGQEIDILIPDIALGIECNGMYWHSIQKGKQSDYHQLKTRKAAEQGIRLIHIFEHEWRERRSTIENTLMMFFVDNPHDGKIVTIEKNLQQEFFNHNHPSGYVASDHGIALATNDIHSSLTFNGDSHITITRFATTTSYQTFIPLFQYITTTFNPETITIELDNRFPMESILEQLGFVSTDQHPRQISYNSLISYDAGSRSWQWNKFE